MLPNKMKISESATNSLRRLQGNTGITPNIGARIAFFKSLERGYRFNPIDEKIEHTGRELDKHTWLGELSQTTELLLQNTYPNFTRQQLHDAWAAHVNDGITSVSSATKLAALFSF
jgi:DNA sulfur modification protein DndE